MSSGGSPTSHAGRMSYRPDIDGLRAVAVLMVVLFHFDLVPYAEAGFLGVDVFFVISGFLITGIIVRGIRDESFRLVDFYANRVRRLAPALLSTLALTLIAGAAWLFPVDFQELTLQALLTQFYASNIYFWFNVNYFGLTADSVYLLHTWSLAVEEQFYLLYPLALLITLRLAPRSLWPLIWTAGLVSFFANLYFVADRPEATFYLLPTRAWEMLVGAVCYQLVSRETISPDRPIRGAETLGALGLGLIAASIFLFEEDFSVPGSFTGLPVLGAAAVIYSGSGVSTAVARGLGQPAIVYVGRLSYPLYLVHWPIDVFARGHFTADYNTTIRAGMLALSFAFAAAIYHWVESPIRRARGTGRSRRLLLGYALSLAATVGVYGLAETTGGLPGRFPDDALRMMAFVEDHEESSVDCGYDDDLGFAASTCRIGAEGAEPSWLIYGDSHAWAARSVFDEWLSRRGEAGRFVFQNSCLPLIGVYLFGNQGRCHRFNEEAFAFVQADEALENVLLVSTWHQPRGSRLSDSANDMISEEERLALFARQFKQTVEGYAGHGKRVYIWEPVPGAKSNVPRGLARAMIQGRENPAEELEIPTRDYRSTFDFFFAAVEANREWITRTYAPSDLLCDPKLCASTLDGQPVYYDSTHIAKSLGGRWVEMMEATDRAAAGALPGDRAS